MKTSGNRRRQAGRALDKTHDVMDEVFQIALDKRLDNSELKVLAHRAAVREKSLQNIKHVDSSPPPKGLLTRDLLSVEPGRYLRITLTRSLISTPPKHRAVIRGLGLKRLRQTVIRPANSSTLGAVKKVSYLLEVDEFDID